MVSSKRFIAGAVCPQCKAVDKIYTLEENHRISRQCTRCEFSELLDEQTHPETAVGDWQPIEIQGPTIED